MQRAGSREVPEHVPVVDGSTTTAAPSACDAHADDTKRTEPIAYDSRPVAVE